MNGVLNEDLSFFFVVVFWQDWFFCEAISCDFENSSVLGDFIDLRVAHAGTRLLFHSASMAPNFLTPVQAWRRLAVIGLAYVEVGISMLNRRRRQYHVIGHPLAVLARCSLQRLLFLCCVTHLSFLGIIDIISHWQRSIGFPMTLWVVNYTTLS